MRQFALLIAAFSLLSISLAAAEPSFPTLSGRIVDTGGLLGRQTQAELTSVLEAHEEATGAQIVFTSVPDLQGYDIETYGNKLARHWGIGEKEKDNGIVLIVAKKERKIRIEVGYGLEELVTDAISANIIHSIILPEFKKSRFEKGVVLGVRALVEASQGEYSPRKRKVNKGFPPPLFALVLIMFVVLIVISSIFGGGGGGSGRRNSAYGYGSGGYNGRTGGGFSGGGFGGGGGSFGGGGASGGW